MELAEITPLVLLLEIFFKISIYSDKLINIFSLLIYSSGCG